MIQPSFSSIIARSSGGMTQLQNEEPGLTDAVLHVMGRISLNQFPGNFSVGRYILKFWFTSVVDRVRGSRGGMMER